MLGSLTTDVYWAGLVLNCRDPGRQTPNGDGHVEHHGLGLALRLHPESRHPRGSDGQTWFKLVMIRGKTSSLTV